MLTAAGFPVLSAMAYGKPVNARPHSPAIRDEDHDPEDPGLEADADDVSHEDHRDRQRDDQDEVGHHQPEEQRQPADRRHEQAVEVSVLDVGDERARRERPVTEDDRHRQLERLEVDARARFGERLGAPMLIVKNTGTASAGTTNSISLGTARIERLAIPRQSARKPAGRARTGAWSMVAVVTRLLLLLLDVAHP